MPKESLKTKTLDRRPTGTITSIAAALLVLLGALGVEINAQVSAAILGVIAAVVAAFNPR